MIKLVPIALSLSFASFAGCGKDTSTTKSDITEVTKESKQPKAAPSVQKTEPLAFRIDGMKRVNGAL